MTQFPPLPACLLGRVGLQSHTDWRRLRPGVYVADGACGRAGDAGDPSGTSVLWSRPLGRCVGFSLGGWDREATGEQLCALDPHW